ncbi:MAG: hypothetical protein ACOH1I_10030 [Gallionellaceae bacterium]
MKAPHIVAFINVLGAWVGLNLWRGVAVAASLQAFICDNARHEISLLSLVGINIQINLHGV